MPLFTDSDLLTQGDLAAIDPEVPVVAQEETIVVEGASGVIATAWDECADALLEAMQAYGGAVQPMGVASALYTGATIGHAASRVYLTQIVAGDRYERKLSALQRWMLYKALVAFYRAAVNRRVFDRYSEKLDRFCLEERRHWRTLAARGLPVVREPLPAPGAVHEFASGSWGSGNVSSVAGGTSAAATYDVAITWVDGARYVSPGSKGNAESGPSGRLALTVPANSLLRIDITSLNPPVSGLLPARTPADGLVSALEATGWLVYAGLPGETLYLQTPSPLAIASKVYTFAGAPLLSGPTLDPGQMPDANYAFVNTLQRV